MMTLDPKAFAPMGYERFPNHSNNIEAHFFFALARFISASRL
jgi:hypothetical protein